MKRNASGREGERDLVANRNCTCHKFDENGQTFGQVSNAFIRLVDASNNNGALVVRHWMAPMPAACRRWRPSSPAAARE